MWTSKLALAATVLLVGAGFANANIIYSWSGFIEPVGGMNPWGLSGDGSALTATDGTPYTMNVFLDQTVVDLDTMNPRTAQFIPTTVELTVGGKAATFVRGLGSFGSALSFFDDSFGTLDRIGLLAQFSLFGTTLTFSSDIRIPITSFTLSDFGVDPPPVFATTFPVQFGGASSGTLLTLPANAPVSSTLTAVPEPSSLALVGVGAVGLLVAALGRRRTRGRGLT